MFFEYDVWIKSTISIIQGIKKKFIQQKGGAAAPWATPKSAPAKSPQTFLLTNVTCKRSWEDDCVTIKDYLRYGSPTKATGRRTGRFTFLG